MTVLPKEKGMKSKKLCKWLRDNSSGAYRPSATAASRIELLEEVASALLEYIDAIPEDIVLPTMPGIDRDWVDSVIDS